LESTEKAGKIVLEELDGIVQEEEEEEYHNILYILLVESHIFSTQHALIQDPECSASQSPRSLSSHPVPSL
jgi:hypothetical protein